MPLAVFGEESSYCRLFKEGCGKYCPCQSSHLHACREADRLKDGYFFSCPANYIHFAVPVYSSHTLRASVLAGPIALEYPDVELIDLIVQKFGLDLSYRSKLYGPYLSVPLIEPHRARHLCKLLTALVSGISSAEDNVFIRRQIAQEVQQAKIGDYIRLLKEDIPLFTSQYDQEKQLISDVLAGNQSHARALLNEMLGRMYFSSGNNFEIIRARAIELTALLSRAVVENGGDQAGVYQMTEDALDGIVAAGDLTGLSYTLLEIMDVFIGMALMGKGYRTLPACKRL